MTFPIINLTAGAWAAGAAAYTPSVKKVARHLICNAREWVRLKSLGPLFCY